MKNLLLLFAVISLLGTKTYSQKSQNDQITGYYTRLPYNDLGFSGKYADIVVDLPGKGQFIFSREYSYQPYWIPDGGKVFLVDRIIPRSGDGPEERPDKNNICSNASIVEKNAESVKVHWRYAPDITKLSFTDFTEAYNKAGGPSEFYAEYADEYFTINADGSVVREAKNGCYSLDDWDDPDNHFLQKFMLTADGIKQKALKQPKLSNRKTPPFAGEKIKKTSNPANLLSFKFDDALDSKEQKTRESLTNTLIPILGVKAYWRKGVSGTSLSFDSYSNAVVMPASKCPVIKGDFTVEAWAAPQEYPFNRAAIVDHMDGKNGYFLGIDARGHIVFRIGISDSIIEVQTNPIPLYKWTHVSATYSSRKGLSVFLNGISSVFRQAAGNFSDAANTDLYLGMTHTFKQYPAGAERAITKSFNTNMVFSGLIDEVSVFDRELTPDEILKDYNSLKPDSIQPLKPWVLPDGPTNKSTGFGASYSKLKYSPEWDGLWRVGDYSDITVTFDKVPWRYVFWRGTRYLPSLVTDYGAKSVWSSDQSPEVYNGQCFEHMSDMLCRYSNARIISGTDARVIVHWRNSSASISYKWPMTDENGWGIWTDEYWTIYPDGVSVRHQVVHNNTPTKISAEMNQNEILHQPGQTTDDVLLDEAVITANADGVTRSWFRSKSSPVKDLKNDKNLQITNLNSGTKQFEIGETGAWIETFLARDVYWNGWNHYPVQLIPSDGTAVLQYDRPASTCPSTLHEVRRVIDNKTIEAIDIYGLTEKSVSDLTNLNRSWNYAPDIADETGCVSLGYEKRERAYKFLRKGDSMSFKILATREKPVANLAIVVSNWKNSDPDNFSFTLNGKLLTSGKDYRKGIETDTNGKNVLVLWLECSSNEELFMLIK